MFLPNRILAECLQSQVAVFTQCSPTFLPSMWLLGLLIVFCPFWIREILSTLVSCCLWMVTTKLFLCAGNLISPVNQWVETHMHARMRTNNGCAIHFRKLTCGLFFCLKKKENVLEIKMPKEIVGHSCRCSVSAAGRFEWKVLFRISWMCAHLTAQEPRFSRGLCVSMHVWLFSA